MFQQQAGIPQLQVLQRVPQMFRLLPGVLQAGISAVSVLQPGVSLAVGSSAGISLAVGSSAGISLAVGSSAGISLAVGSSAGISLAVGSSAGVSLAVGSSAAVRFFSGWVSPQAPRSSLPPLLDWILPQRHPDPLFYFR
jgi:hypothetical protein